MKYQCVDANAYLFDAGLGDLAFAGIILSQSNGAEIVSGGISPRHNADDSLLRSFEGQDAPHQSQSRPFGSLRPLRYAHSRILFYINGLAFLEND